MAGRDFFCCDDTGDSLWARYAALSLSKTLASALPAQILVLSSINNLNLALSNKHSYAPQRLMPALYIRLEPRRIV